MQFVLFDKCNSDVPNISYDVSQDSVLVTKLQGVYIIYQSMNQTLCLCSHAKHNT